MKRLVAFLIICSIFLTGCGDYGIEKGFTTISSVEDMPEKFVQTYCGVRSNKAKFDANDVVLGVYLGQSYTANKVYGNIFAAAKIYAAPYSVSNAENAFLLKDIDNFFIEDYECTLTKKGVDKGIGATISKIDYTFSENIKIPREVFRDSPPKGAGDTYFSIFIVFEYDDFSETEIFLYGGHIMIYYEIEGDKLQLLSI